MRDRNFIAEHRGGRLTPGQHRSLMGWGIACAEHVLPLLPGEADPRLLKALAVARQWQAGALPTGAAQKASVAAHAAARAVPDALSTAVARSIAQAVATAHFADHAPVAADYARKAAALAGGSVEAEQAWQTAQLSDDIRPLVRPAA